MLNLNGVLSNFDVGNILNITNDRFKEPSKFNTPESLIIYENNFLDEDTLLELVREAYSGYDIVKPVISYIPTEVVKLFEGSGYVPASYNPVDYTVTLLRIPEYLKYTIPYTGKFKTEIVHTTIYYYLQAYTKLYGIHPEIQTVSSKDCLELLFEEAISLNSTDLTITTEGNKVIAYNEVYKQKIVSKRIFDYKMIEDFIKILTIKSPNVNINDKKPKYIGYTISNEYRARIVINKTLQGYAITCRIFPQEEFNSCLDTLGFKQDFIDFMRNEFNDKENGLRLIVGGTASGKNTTCFAAIREIRDSDPVKIVSVEKPVERLMTGIEQIDTESDEDYKLNVESLIRQNPGLVYLTEMSESTGSSIMAMSNTAKRVISTIHANSVADTITRVMDITGLSADRVIQVLHSIIYQELEPVSKDKVVPKVKYIRLNDALKFELYGKPLGVILKTLKENERG